jgi:hypothetical protein
MFASAGGCFVEASSAADAARLGASFAAMRCADCAASTPANPSAAMAGACDRRFHLPSQGGVQVGPRRRDASHASVRAVTSRRLHLYLGVTRRPSAA